MPSELALGLTSAGRRYMQLLPRYMQLLPRAKINRPAQFAQAGDNSLWPNICNPYRD
jgi:hypothetical protein